MAITLPVASPRSAGTGARRAARAPEARNVAHVTPISDPGVRVPTMPTGGLEAIGDALGDVGASLQAAEKREVAEADARWTVGLIGLGDKYKGDRDHFTLADRFKSDANDLHASVVEGMSEGARATFERQASIDAARAMSSVRGRANDLAMDATRKWLDDSLVDIRNSYLTATDGAGRVLAVEGAEAVISAAEARGAIDAEVAGTLKRNFETDAAKGRISMMSDPEAMRVLRSGTGIAAALDPAERAVLLRRAEARHEVVVGREVNDAIAVLNQGRVPPDITTVRAAAEGTRYAQALQEAIEDRDVVEGFVRKPLREQRALLASRPETISRRDLALENRLLRAHQNLRTQAEAGHGLAMAEQAGVIERVAPVDFNDLTTLRARAVQAELASEWLGMPVSPLTPAEADSFVPDTSAPDDVVYRFRATHEAMGEDGSAALISSIAPRRPALAVAMRLSPYRPDIAREIVAGSRLDAKDRLPTKTDRLDEVETEFQGVFKVSPEALSAFVAAADAIYLNRVVGKAEEGFDAKTYRAALQDAAGGVVEYNDQKVLAPVPGMSEGDFIDAVRALTDDELKTFGNGVPIFADATVFPASMLRRAKLVSTGIGRYAIEINEAYITTPEGEPYEIDLAALLRGAL